MSYIYDIAAVAIIIILSVIGYKKGILISLLGIVSLVAAGAEIHCGAGVYAVADADEKAREQEHQRCGRADGAQRLRSRKLSDDRNIRHIEKHLKHV